MKKKKLSEEQLRILRIERQTAKDIREWEAKQSGKNNPPVLSKDIQKENK